MSSPSQIRRFICNYDRADQRKDPELIIRLARHLARVPLGIGSALGTHRILARGSPYCHAALTLAGSYSRWTASITVAFVIALGIATHRVVLRRNVVVLALPLRYTNPLDLGRDAPIVAEGWNCPLQVYFRECIFLATIDIFVVVLVLFTIAVLLLGSFLQHLAEEHNSTEVTFLGHC